MSYFAKPNFIAYDEWFDDNNKNKLDVKNKEIKTISNLHEFFYEQSNYKIGASEHNMQLEFKSNERELFIKNYLENTSDKNAQLSIKKFRLFERLKKSKLKFILTKKIIFSLSIFSLALILGLTLFFISQSRKDESNITNKPIELEKGF